MTEATKRTRCLWRADDGRCANCKAKRFRHDVLGMQDYDNCISERDYPSCDFFKEKPVPPGKS
ncbi:MAG: hypothetical protein HPY73_04550 [Methanomassiliicoccales archaeon]|nr:MAG: hypothetical protein HPY73_04550 [Methanomassiliicoccales archaeon]